MSVLTEPTFFKGSLQDLSQAKKVAQAAKAASCPLILRKDFIVSPYQVVEARAAGADTLLLIVAILSDEELSECIVCARELGMEPLVEAANEAEMLRALRVGARVIGVNNRNLRTFKVDLHTTARCLQAAQGEVQPGSPLVHVLSLSGVRGCSDVATIRQGCSDTDAVRLAGVLVGEALMKSADPASLVASFQKALHGETTTPIAFPGFVKVCGVCSKEDALAVAGAGASAVGIIRVPGSKRCVAQDVAKDIVSAVQGFREQDPAPELASGLAAAAAACSSDPTASRSQVAASAPTQASTAAWFRTFWQQGLAAAVARAPPLTVGVYRNLPSAEVAADAAACGFDLVQLHGDEGWEEALNIPQPVIKVLHVAPASEEQSALEAARGISQHLRPGTAAVLLLDTRVPGSEGGGAGVRFDWAIPAALQQLHAPQGLPLVVAGGLGADSVSAAVAASQARGVDVSSGVEDSARAPAKELGAVAAFVSSAHAALEGVQVDAAAGAAAAEPPTS